MVRGAAPPPANAGHLTPLITALVSREAADRPDVAAARTLLADEPPTKIISGPGGSGTARIQPPPGDTKEEPAKPGAPIAAVLICLVMAVLAIGYFSDKDDDAAASVPDVTTTTEYTPPVVDTGTIDTETYEEETYPETETVSLDELPDPCDAPGHDTLDLFGLGAPKPESDDSSRTCYWYAVDDGMRRSYGILPCTT